MIHDTAELISLGLTWPTILMGLGVLWHWGGEAFRAWSKPHQERTPTDWLILGVGVGFLGGVLDNAYWGIAWSSSFLEHESQGILFSSGVYFNIPFRQIAGLYAGYCHLESYFVNKKQGKDRLKNAWVFSALLAFIYVVALLWMANDAR